jgi:iron(III) transport system substrate-binding protein
MSRRSGIVPLAASDDAARERAKMKICSRVLITILATSVGSLAAAAPALAADDALIAAAKKEGELIWYTTQIITQIGRPMMEAFQKKYGIRVNAVRGDSVELAVRLLNEAKAGRVQADVFDGTTTSVSIKKAGVALKWQPDATKQLPKEFWDSEGYWVANNVYVHTPAFNTSLVPRGSEPKTWEDLLDPKWKGKMAWATHATTSGAAGFVGLVLTEFGEEKGKAYLRNLARQDIVRLGGSARAVTDQAIAGEYAIVLQIFNHQPLISSQQGAPIDWIPMSPAMAILSVASVAAGARHPNAAKLFVDFLISDDGQKLFRDRGYIPVAPAIPPSEPKLRPDGKTFRGIFITPEEIDMSMPRWTEKFDEIFR